MVPTTRSRRSDPVLAGPGKASFSLHRHESDARPGDGCGPDLADIGPDADRASGVLSTEPEVADRSFGRCGLDRTHACVVDGDTFRIGKRRVRIVGIDVPEVNARFESERTLAVAATVKLQSILNQGHSS